MVSGNTLAIRP